MPTATALATKHVNIDILCPWCHSVLETDNHVLFSCDFAKTVWLTAGMASLVQNLTHETAFLVLNWAFSVCTRAQCVLIDMLCWSVWNRRSNWVWERNNGSVFGVRAAATNLLGEWNEAQVRENRRSMQMNAGAHVWVKPSLGW